MVTRGLSGLPDAVARRVIGGRIRSSRTAFQDLSACRSTLIIGAMSEHPAHSGRRVASPPFPNFKEV